MTLKLTLLVACLVACQLVQTLSIKIFTVRTHAHISQRVHQGNQTINVDTDEDAISTINVTGGAILSDWKAEEEGLNSFKTAFQLKEFPEHASLSGLSPLSDCGSAYVNLRQTSLQPCGGDPCYVTSRPLNLTIAFVSKIYEPSLQCIIQIQKGSTRKNFSCGAHNICEAAGMHCPLQPGELNSFSLLMQFPPAFPTGLFYVSTALLDPQQHQVLCVKADLRK